MIGTTEKHCTKPFKARSSVAKKQSGAKVQSTSQQLTVSLCAWRERVGVCVVHAAPVMPRFGQHAAGC
jgi:hypothetical protein